MSSPVTTPPASVGLATGLVSLLVNRDGDVLLQEPDSGKYKTDHIVLFETCMEIKLESKSDDRAVR